MPARKDFTTKAARQYYTKSKSMKKINNHTFLRLKEWLYENPVSDTNSVQLVMDE